MDAQELVTVQANNQPHKKNRSHLTYYFIAAVLAWTVALALSLFYNIHTVRQHTLDLAGLQAQAAFEKDLIYRRWSSNMNGVYVIVDGNNIKPNIYLPLKDRDLYLTDGRMITQINPAYMTRLVYSLNSKSTGIINHITSNMPIRPENAPDEWEAQALREIESGQVKEVRAIQSINGQPYLRSIFGLETEQSCLNCHAAQGYKVGEIRGGITINIPMALFSQATSEQYKFLLGSHGGLWLLGLIGIGLGTRSLNAHLKERNKAEDAMRKMTEELETRVAQRTADLKHSKGELSAVIDNANAGVFLKDINGNYLIANTLFADIINQPLENIIGNTNANLLAPQVEQLLSAQEQTVIQTKQAAESESIYFSPINRQYSCFSFPILDQNKVIGIGGLLVDMTEREAVEQSLREARDAAEQANKAKTEFLANISHEIRTPLNGLIGMADLLSRTRLTPDQISMLSVIKNSGDALLTVLNDVLDISKITADKLVLESHPFPIRETLHNAIKGFTSLAQKKHLEIILYISPKVPYQIIGDSTRIRQVVMNLVSNALKFTEQGEVVISVTLLESDNNKNQAKLRFAVRDTGIGIPLDKQEKITQPFEQADSSTTRKYGGTGLGLAICTRLLELMGSKLEIKSSEGFGSCFWFDICVAVETEADPKTSLIDPHTFEHCKVLIVDDNETNLRVLNEMLSQWNMLVTDTTSAEKAYHIAKNAVQQKQGFDIVLTDYQMPQNDGANLLWRFKSDPELTQTPLILLSSSPAPQEMNDAIGTLHGFSAILNNPLLSDALIQAICHVLNTCGNSKIHSTENISKSILSKQNEITPRKILLVEDVEMNQLVATRMLKELGHNVSIASNGQEAVEKLQQEHFDLIFMDIQMPVMDGVQATHAIRDLEKQGVITGHTTIIAMTANAFQGDKENYLANGMDGYLAKPIRLDRLQEIIHTFAKAKETQASDIVSTSDGITPANHENNISPDTEETFKGASLIDHQLLKQNFNNDRDFIIQIMQVFLTEAPELMQKILQAIDTNDNKALSVAGHSLKGIVSYFNRDELRSLCLDFEQMGKEKKLPRDKQSAQKKATQLEKLLTLLYAQINEFMKN